MAKLPAVPLSVPVRKKPRSSGRAFVRGDRTRASCGDTAQRFGMRHMVWSADVQYPVVLPRYVEGQRAGQQLSAPNPLSGPPQPGPPHRFAHPALQQNFTAASTRPCEQREEQWFMCLRELSRVEISEGPQKRTAGALLRSRPAISCSPTGTGIAAPQLR
jgi:hypothetical protein